MYRIRKRQNLMVGGTIAAGGAQTTLHINDTFGAALIVVAFWGAAEASPRIQSITPRGAWEGSTGPAGLYWAQYGMQSQFDISLGLDVVASLARPNHIFPSSPTPGTSFHAGGGGIPHPNIYYPIIGDAGVSPANDLTGVNIQAIICDHADHEPSWNWVPDLALGA